MALNLGQVLEQRYRIDALLGQGGMGAVYLATDLKFGTPVAIKENQSATPESQRQFSREAGLLHRLRHPNLPRVTDYFFIPSQGQYLVMDYVEGEDLKQVLTRQMVVSQRQVVEWICQVLEALAYLHSEGIIHRDVKPANVKITPIGQVFLVDFGLAKLYDPVQDTTVGARGITPGYAPPEQYGPGRTDARTDIYSVGATLYALLTGQIPPDALDCMLRRAELVPPRQFNPAILIEIEAAILKAMQLAPANRFQTAPEFRMALLRAEKAKREASAAPPPVLEAPRKESQSVRMPSAVADKPRPAPVPGSAGKEKLKRILRRRTTWLWAVAAVIFVIGGWWLLATDDSSWPSGKLTMAPVVMTHTPISTSTLIPTASSTPAPTASSTPAPTASSTPTPTASSTPAPTAFSTPTPEDVVVAANEKWKETGIQIEEGDTVQITRVSGKWRTESGVPWTNGSDCTSYSCHDCLLPTAPEGSLIAKIDDGDAFCVGSSPSVSKQSGILFLSFNDADSWFHDNEGSLTARVKILTP